MSFVELRKKSYKYFLIKLLDGAFGWKDYS